MYCKLKFFFEKELQSVGVEIKFVDGNMLLEAKDTKALRRMENFVKDYINKLNNDIHTGYVSMTAMEFEICESDIKGICEPNQIHYVHENDMLTLNAVKEGPLVPIKREIESNIKTRMSASKQAAHKAATHRNTFVSSQRLSGNNETTSEGQERQYNHSKYTDTATAQTASGGARPKHAQDVSVRAPLEGSKSEFFTKERILVRVYESDILKTKVDCIVNAANRKLSHHGGIAEAISKAAGYKLDCESNDFIKRNGPLNPGEVCCTNAGKLSFEKVIHAIGPVWSDSVSFK